MRRLVVSVAALALALSACTAEGRSAEAEPSATPTGPVATDAAEVSAAAAAHLRREGSVSFQTNLPSAGHGTWVMEGGLDKGRRVYGMTLTVVGQDRTWFGDSDGSFRSVNGCWKRLPGTVEHGLPGMEYVDYLFDPTLAEDPGTGSRLIVVMPLEDAAEWIFPLDAHALGMKAAGKTVEVWVDMDDGRYAGATLPVWPLVEALEEAGATFNNNHRAALAGIVRYVRVLYTDIGEELDVAAPAAAEVKQSC